MNRLSAVQLQRERGGEHRPGGARRKCTRERKQALRSTTAERMRWGASTRRSTKEMREGARAGSPQYNRRENEVGSIDQEEHEGNARGSMSRLSTVQPQREQVESLLMRSEEHTSEL